MRGDFTQRPAGELVQAGPSLILNVSGYARTEASTLAAVRLGPIAVVVGRRIRWKPPRGHADLALSTRPADILRLRRTNRSQPRHAKRPRRRRALFRPHRHTHLTQQNKELTEQAADLTMQIHTLHQETRQVGAVRRSPYRLPCGSDSASGIPGGRERGADAMRAASIDVCGSCAFSTTRPPGRGV